MANTFLAAQGREMGDSLVERDRLEVARGLLARAAELGVEVVLPTDLVVTDDLDRPGDVATVAAADGIAPGRKAVDVGPATRAAFAARIAGARTLFWNGPLGVFEKPPFDAGTRAAAEALADCAGFTVIGGGETVAAAHQAGVARPAGPRLDRRRRLAGAARRQDPAGDRRPGAAPWLAISAAAARWSPPTGR